MANAIAHPCASYKATRSTHWPAKCAHFGHWHNALVDPTSIRVIILSGGFELEPISDVGTNHGRVTIIATTPMTSTPTLTLLGIGNRVVVSYADNLAICNRCKWAPLALVLQSVPKNFRNSASILDVKVFRSPRISLPTITS